MRSQEAWRCPNAGYPEPTIHDPPLEAPARAALRAVKAVTGACGFRTCPLWYTQHEWIGDAIAAWRAEAKGSLEARVGKPSLALYQAIEVIDAAFLARKASDLKKKLKGGDEGSDDGGDDE
jgi:hypothetical protein